MEALNAIASRRHALLAEALAAVSERAEASGHDTWTLHPAGSKRRINLQLDERWLTAETPSRRASLVGPAQVERKLAHNARLAGGVRIAAHGNCCRGLLLELPAKALSWSSHSALAAEIAATIDRLLRAPGPSGSGVRSRKPNGGEHDEPLRQVSDDQAKPAEDLAALFEEAGWSLRSPEPERATVPLEVADDYVEAQVLERDATLGLRLGLFEQRFENADPASRRAVGWMLWRVANSTRLVKPMLLDQRLTLEVDVPRHPVAVAQACCALSTALSQCTNEARHLLEDSELARTYLATTAAAGTGPARHDSFSTSEAIR